MSTPQMYVGRKAAKAGARYVGRRVRKRAVMTVDPRVRGGIGRIQAGVYLAAGAAVGLALGYALDPRRRGQRTQMAQHMAAGARSHASDMASAARHAAGQAQGAAAQVTAPARAAMREQPDDVTLAHKVETQVFRAADAPKGKVDVNAEGGVVYLRGEVDSPETIARLVRDAEGVQGVRAVQSLLHLPGAPAPARDDARVRRH